MTIADKIIERCSRPGGSDRASLVALFRQYQRTEARQRIDALVASGDVLRFTRRPTNGKGRDAQQFFTDAADGARWAGASVIEPRPESVRKAARKANPKPVPITFSKAKRTLSLPADAVAVVPAGVKRTVQLMPSFDPRYQVDPSTRVLGGFASAGIGRYLDGKP